MTTSPVTTTETQEKSFGEKAAVLAIVVGPLLATVYAVILLWQQYVDGRDLLLLGVFYLLSGLGITVGFHRLLTHKSFETSAPIRALFLILGCMAIEGNPIAWASNHIQHHAHADHDDDPHSPLKSLWHAHIGWLFTQMPQIDRYGSWLVKDRLVVWVDRTWLLWVGLGLLLPFALGGWSGLLWGGLVRVCLLHHVTWSVNSICHTFGNRAYETKDASRNNGLIGLLAFGEGWHNNHHAFPRSAFHGLRWWQFDLSAYLIRSLELLGLARKVYRVPAHQLQRRGALHASAQYTGSQR